jgi:hypothetical protein
MFSIQNPAALEGPREFVLLRASEPFPIGVVKREGIGLQENTRVVLCSFRCIINVSMLLMKFDRRNKAKYNFNFDILNTKCL